MKSLFLLFRKVNIMFLGVSAYFFVVRFMLQNIYFV